MIFLTLLGLIDRQFIYAYEEPKQVLYTYSSPGGIFVEFDGPAELPYYLTPFVFCLLYNHGWAQICLPIQRQHWKFTFQGPFYGPATGYLYYGLNNWTSNTFGVGLMTGKIETFAIPTHVIFDIKWKGLKE